MHEILDMIRAMRTGPPSPGPNGLPPHPPQGGNGAPPPPPAGPPAPLPPPPPAVPANSDFIPPVSLMDGFVRELVRINSEYPLFSPFQTVRDLGIG